MTPLSFRRLVMTLVGMIGTAMACGLLQYADLGIDPFNAMIVGLNNISPFDYGLTFMIVTALMLLLTFVLDKTFIGFATLLNLFAFGYVVQYTLKFAVILIQSPSIMVRVMSLLVGLLMISVCVSLYFTGNLGVSAYDALSLIASKRSKFSFRLLRVLSDVSCVLIGFTLGANIGIATLVTAFLLGPAIDYFNRHLSQPLLVMKQS